MACDLFAHLQEEIAKEFLDFAAAQANHVGMFLLEARFVIVLVAVVMHQVQLVHQAACFQQLERPVDCDPVQLGVFFARQFEQALGVQMLAGLVDQIEQNLALPRQPDAALLERIPDAGSCHGRWPRMTRVSEWLRLPGVS